MSHPEAPAEDTTELLAAYTASGELVGVEPRKPLLARIRAESCRTGDAALAVESFYLMLCNSAGKLYIVQRGNKPENPWLWDKTAGGHVLAGESYSSALRREAMEELGIDVILTDLSDYPREVQRLDTRRLAVVRAVDFVPWLRSVRMVRDGEPWVKRHRSMIYAGRFDGKPQFRDREAIDWRLLTPAQLAGELQHDRQSYTYDLGIILDHYPVFLW